MSKENLYSQIVKSVRKYFFFFIMLLLTFLIKPIYLHTIPDENTAQIKKNIEYKLYNKFIDKFNEVQEFHQNAIKIVKQKKDNSFDSLFMYYKSKDQFFTNYRIYRNNKLLFWSSGNNEIYNTSVINKSPAFIKNSLYINLVFIDSLYLKGDVYKIISYSPFEKLYSFNNEYELKYSFENELEEENRTGIKVDYFFNLNEKSKVSYLIKNKKRNLIRFFYTLPDKDYLENLRNERITSWQVSIALCLIIFFSYSQLKRLKKINSKILKIIIIICYSAIIRYSLYYFDFPSRLLTGWIIDSAYFSSVFGYGIVSSPLELFITCVFCLLISYKLVNYIIVYYTENRKNLTFITFLWSLFLVFVLLMTFRGFGATIRSIVYDSTLLYFSKISLIPDYITILMHLNLLIIGFSFILILLTIAVLIISNFKQVKLRIVLAAFFFFIQAASFLFDFVQQDPQGTDVIRILFYTILILELFVIIINKNIVKSLLMIVFIGSFFTIIFLLHYNDEREKDYIKTITNGIVNQDRNYIAFLTEESINSSVKFMSTNKEKTSFNTQAFLLWNNSALQKSNTPCAFYLLNEKKQPLGSFIYKTIPINDYLFDSLDYNPVRMSLKKYKEINYTVNQVNSGINKYYLVIKIDNRINEILSMNTPVFMEGLKDYSNTPASIKELKIFDFKERILVNIYGNINPPLFIQEKILNAVSNKKQENWIEIELNKTDYLAYVIKYKNQGNAKTLAIAIPKKNTGRQLFDYFKVFFIHILFILGTLVMIFLLNTRKITMLKMSFRNKLFFWFVVVSILPLILIGIYLRNMAVEKNDTADFYRLKKNALDIEKYINSFQQDDKISYDVFNKAAIDLGINYYLYEKGKHLFSSNNIFSKIGIKEELLNPEVLYKLEVKGFNEILTEDQIENYKYKSFYYYGVIQGKYLIIKVDDIFSDYQPPFGGNELDVFIFGSFSLAFILIIIASSFISKQISTPVRNLTEATKLVAHGNFDITIDNKYSGEIASLVDGFNRMIIDLKRSRIELAEMERLGAWKNMARQIAHEIKNPLTPMKLAVQQLMIMFKDRSPKFEDAFIKITNMLDSQIDHIKNITNEFSSFARLPKPQINNHNLINLLHSIIPMFTEVRVNIVNKTDNMSINIQADDEQIKRAIINLIKNAIQASATEISIIISKNRKFEIRIQDNGNGIPKEITAEIFKAEFTTKIEGMGLGLYISRLMIEGMDGELILESSKKNDTIFLITIPETEG